MSVSTLSIDDACTILMVIAREQGLHHVDITVNADGRVGINGYDTNGFGKWRETADLCAGGAHEAPSAAASNQLTDVMRAILRAARGSQ